MRSFDHIRPPSLPDAALAARDAAVPSAFLAGGTTLLDLMKLGVLQPQRLIDLGALRADFGQVRIERQALRLGAFARMAEVAAHPEVIADYPVIAQSLALAASAQLRNMATLGGNVLQRTRCPYFRDPSWSACNRRMPGSGCAAIDGANRGHAVLGASEACIATYPGDFAQALVALEASVVLAGPRGRRAIPFATLHLRPGSTPHLETGLRAGEIIVEFIVPARPLTRRSLYLKIRDRQSYEFALASAAVALDLADGVVRDARIALSGVASVPWRAQAAEDALRGVRLDGAAAENAARAAFAGAVPRTHNGFKIALGQATLVRALLQLASLEITA